MMIWKSLFAVLILFSITSTVAAENSQAVTPGSVVVHVTPQKTGFSFGGPIGVVIDIANNTDKAISCDFMYPEPWGLSFSPDAAQGVKQSTFELPQPGTFTPLVIKEKSTYRCIMYLNRYLTFPSVGVYHINYLFYADVEPFPRLSFERNPLGTISAKGTLDVLLLPVKPIALRHELQETAKNLSSANEQKRLEAEQALRYLNDSFAADLLLFYGDWMAVDTLLEDLSKRKVLLSDNRLKFLLSDPNSFKRYDTVQYIARVGNANHIPMLQPLIQDQNRGITKLVITAIQDLQDKPAPE